MLDLPQLLDAVEDIPLDALGRRVLDIGARLHRIAVIDLGSGHAQLEQGVELGDGGNLEAGALLDQDLEDARVGVGLDSVVRVHPRHGRLEAADLGADDVGVYQQERTGVALLDRLADVLEVQADFRMGIEELGWFGFGGGGWLRVLEGGRALGHQCSPGDLRLR
jgi:hypothetical protein